MKKVHFLLRAASVSVFLLLCFSCQRQTRADYPFQPVTFTSVHFSDNFWLPRLETNKNVTIPFALDQSEKTGRLKNFEIAGGAAEGKFCSIYPFDDSDVYKIIEGASYTLNIQRDPELEEFLDELIAKIAAAQEEDGYLYTARTIKQDPPVQWTEGDRWSNLYLGHELYNMGHFYEAAVAHHLATGKRNMLDLAIKNADLITSVFGPGKKIGVPGHQEIEIGLVKLYRITGDQKYLDLAKHFLDQRGREEGRELFGQYSQDHIPILEQNEAVGHAVRAAYMYSGIADVAALTGDAGYIQTVDRIWENVVSKKMYITGGIGARGGGEAFGPNYELPNASAYAETCAAIANAFWNQRMFLLHGDGKYIDVLEKVIYNGMLSGVGLSGDLFFYPNPLESFGQHERSSWFNCACCPSNISRFMPSIPGYAYAQKGKALFVNLFVDSETDIVVNNNKISVIQETEYPWEGKVRIRLEPEAEKKFAVHVRIPGWALEQPVPSDLYHFVKSNAEIPTVSVNGETVPLDVNKGYLRIQRTWKRGDTIELNLPMPVRRVESHPEVIENTGKIALVRGPVVYCAEWPDNSGQVSNLVLPDDVLLSTEHRDDLLEGVTVIRGQAVALYGTDDESSNRRETQEFTAIPYYAWAHRGPGEMSVWISREETTARPLPESTVASKSQTRGSQDISGEPLNDQWEPEDSNDHSHPYLHWWPRKGTEEWVEYEFEKPTTVSEVRVYWFDDTGQGECRVPQSWTLRYKSGDRWTTVSSLNAYSVEKDKYNLVAFKPIKTSALRLEIQLQKEFSAGIIEWKVK
ncbi:MAG: glycoside hydrolase family 127 protein [Candidatus Aminicenantes bacterium]|nr:glycoside hydrolase family 127 protein [Candidatus Aminicenantes bacterium]